MSEFHSILHGTTLQDEWITSYFQTIDEHCMRKHVPTGLKDDAKGTFSTAEFYSFSEENLSYLNELCSKLKVDQSQTPGRNPWKFETLISTENNTDTKGGDSSVKMEVDVKDVSVIEVDSSLELSMVIDDADTVETPAKKMKIEPSPTTNQESSTLTEDMQVHVKALLYYNFKCNVIPLIL